jgi:hypothetical protein
MRIAASRRSDTIAAARLESSEISPLPESKPAAYAPCSPPTEHTIQLRTKT